MTRKSSEADASNDADCCETTREDCQSSSRTLVRLYHKLVGNPFFPLLFISETFKLAALGEPVAVVAKMAGLAVMATIMWVVSDAIDVDVERTDNGIIK